ncbi:hypothetical protein N9878_02375, partial [bacterium]|nr:hypothetical protein [bacterium]
MKTNFKPLGLAAAVAAASVGYAGVVNSSVVANNGLGDLALIPYYTVNDGFGTGVHMINTSDRTQVVKLRFRRGSDSMDAMDFNIIMSPFDEWTGFLKKDDAGLLSVSSKDSTCTAPLFEDGNYQMPNIYSSGAEEGYIEVIAMGAPTSETMALAVNAKHKPNGDPLNCQYVEDNFLDAQIGQIAMNGDTRGVIDTSTSSGYLDTFAADGTVSGTNKDAITTYDDGGNFLKVSWFIRDSIAGLEMGNDAVHIADFAPDGSPAMITNQEQGVYSGNLRGFDFPDLNGGSPSVSMYGGGAPQRGYFDGLRAGDVLGVSSVINDWSNNSDLNVATDWIVTFPGQYLQLDLPRYFGTLGNFGGLGEGQGGVVGEGSGFCNKGDCDNRDLPVVATFAMWDREENIADAPPGDRDVVISPSIPGLPPLATILRYETNVIHWSDREVFDSQYDEVDLTDLRDLLEADSGWARLNVTSGSAIAN